MLNHFFGKRSIFWRNCKKLFWGRIWTFFRERGFLGQKLILLFFYHELGNGCFIINKFFEKSSIFGEKIAKNPFVGGHGRFRRLATKISITFFVGIHVLNIFHLTTFSKKTIFSKIKTKNYFFWGGGWPFLREGGRTTKMNITFIGGKWGYQIQF